MDAAPDILTGLMKAFAFLARPKPKPRQKFVYERSFTAIHARRRLTAAENKTVKALTSELATLDPRKDRERVGDIMKELNKQPVKFVQMKREHRIDRSKTYPYHSPRRFN
ncbi:hypothetical protein [Bradyrhizobium sp. SZCCHNR3118]|uniref:hypothetical protein n=1 Tax=Bradyrhizobium sp. SZCCHNR3118 TaxID=3057468 RepID=UPI002916C225|nr:hypothetical protein [Bradyrhizobium sp. SZCCHNR3118]